MPDFEVAIRGGTVVDGTGAPGRRADLGIAGGLVAKIGRIGPSEASRTLDASDHYDAQIRWDPYCTISDWHGVTSVVLGKCGLGANSLQGDYDGTPMVTDTMRDEDCLALGDVLAKRGEGFIQITQATGNPVRDRALEEQLAWLERCNRDGLHVFGQALTGRGPFTFTLESWSLYDSAPAWREALTAEREDEKRKLSDPSLRRRMVAESDAHLLAEEILGGPVAGLIVHPVEAVLDLALATDLRAELQTENGTSSSPETMRELLRSPFVIPGVSDGGSHTGFLTGGSYTTDFLTWLVRDTETVALEEAHRRLSALPAQAAGFRDRGTLRVGAPADVVVYDLARLRRLPDWNGEVVHDLPAGEWRRVQRSEGYRWTLVNGQVTFEDGKCTGATPGRLLRHGVG